MVEDDVYPGNNWLTNDGSVWMTWWLYKTWSHAVDRADEKIQEARAFALQTQQLLADDTDIKVFRGLK